MKLIIIPMTVSLIIGCEKQNLNKNEATNDSEVVNIQPSELLLLDQAKAFINADYDGVIHIENISNYGLAVGDMTTNLQAGYINGEGSTNICQGDIKLNGTSIPCLSDYYSYSYNIPTSQIEGAMISLEWYNQSSTRFMNETLYYPEAIEANIPSTISENTTITWNADNNTDKGVAIVVSTRWSKRYLHPESTSEQVYDFLDLDNGTYTFGSDMINAINAAGGSDPDMLIEVEIVRGDYKLVTPGASANDVIAISTMTAVSALCEFEAD